jgi:hypothetical protein
MDISMDPIAVEELGAACHDKCYDLVVHQWKLCDLEQIAYDIDRLAPVPTSL